MRGIDRHLQGSVSRSHTLAVVFQMTLSGLWSDRYSMEQQLEQTISGLFVYHGLSIPSLYILLELREFG